MRLARGGLQSSVIDEGHQSRTKRSSSRGRDSGFSQISPSLSAAAAAGFVVSASGVEVQ